MSNCWQQQSVRTPCWRSVGGGGR